MSGSLQERLKHAGGRKHAVAAATRTPPVVFPLSAVGGYLRRHKLVDAVGASEAEVHSALLDVHRRLVSLENEPSLESPSASRCSTCGGHVLLDAREAAMVCEACGLVQHRGRLNIAPEYAPPAKVRRTSAPVPKGVPLWMFRRSLSDDVSRHRSKHWGRMQHFNVYVGLGEDDLARMDRILTTWTEGGHSANARIAAALLYPPLRKCIPTEHAMRDRIRRGEPIPVVDTTVPEAEFGCEGCGRRSHTRKEARFCCRLKKWGRRAN
jgi:hypothetical protein